MWSRRWLTFLQLVRYYDQESHRDHEEVEDEHDLTELPDRRPTHILHHTLVCVLTTDGGVAQDYQATDEEHQGHLGQMRDKNTIKRLLSGRREMLLISELESRPMKDKSDERKG